LSYSGVVGGNPLVGVLAGGLPFSFSIFSFSFFWIMIFLILCSQLSITFSNFKTQTFILERNFKRIILSGEMLLILLSQELKIFSFWIPSWTSGNCTSTGIFLAKIKITPPKLRTKMIKTINDNI